MEEPSKNGHAVRKLDLSDVESNLRRLLLDVAKHVNPGNPSELRFTGGWVRDKLLGVGSHDIDVAINDMTGLQFGLNMKEYLDIPGHPEKYGLQGVATDEASGMPKVTDKSKVVQGLHKIEANPEKSKHLETVTTKIFGLDIDLVNLRKETYTEDSRIPMPEFGTPKEDALRRDATINAMFYNLQTESIEDLTGCGFDDMRDRIIRTPLEPYQTFKDDPLRVLRLIRFASRLQYTIDDEAKAAMKENSIKQALRAKISRERIGIELEKMLKGPHPRMALVLIDQLGLYDTIFTDPTVEPTYSPDTRLWRPSFERLNNLATDVNWQYIRDLLLLDDDQKYVAWVLSCFTPWFDAPEPTASKSGGKIPPPAAVAVAREGIKATNKVCDIVGLAVRNAEEIGDLKHRLFQRQKNLHKPIDGQDPCSRDTLGMAVRRWGPTWRSQVIFTIMLESARGLKDEKELIREWNTFLSHIQSLDLLSAYDFKPLVDGKALAKALNTRPGPWMKDALDVVMAWQLRNPETATAEGAIEAVKSKQGEPTAVLVRHFLQLTIRPLFAKTQTHDEVTAQGRRVANKQVMPRRYEGAEDDEARRPWKNPKEHYVLELLAWVVESLKPKLTEQCWPLLIPPILTLLDDVDITYKIQGCNNLSALLRATPPALLARTGLGKVFHAAIEPSLSYLPTLTPEPDSILLLNAAYPALLSLGRVRFPTPPSSITTEPSKTKIEFLAQLLHTHILPSISHIHNAHPLLVATLLRHTTAVLDALAVDTIAQLVYISPLLTSIMTAPFAAAEPTLPAEAARTMQAVLRNAWPRTWYWRGEILRALCGCWIEVLEEEERWFDGGPRVREEGEDGGDMERFAEVKRELRVAAQMLVAAVEAMKDVAVDDAGDVGTLIDVRGELAQLVDADGRLGELFHELMSA